MMIWLYDTTYGVHTAVRTEEQVATSAQVRKTGQISVTVEQIPTALVSGTKLQQWGPAFWKYSVKK